MSARTIRTISWSVAAVAVLAGLLAWVVPPGVDVPALAPAAPTASMAASSSTALPAYAEEIVLANAFASSRSAPSTRYTPVEQMTDTAAGMTQLPGGMPTMPMMPGLDSLSLAGEVPKLYGTVVSPDGTKALLHLAGAGPSLYSAGDRDGAYRVISIAPGVVVLRGPTGRVTLRLEPEEERP